MNLWEALTGIRSRFVLMLVVAFDDLSFAPLGRRSMNLLVRRRLIYLTFSRSWGDLGFKIFSTIGFGEVIFVTGSNF